MSLFQLSSTALDGFSTSMAVLAMSLYQALSKAKPRHRPIFHACMVFCILVVVPARLHLWPLLILPLISALKMKQSWAWFTSLACLSTVLIWVARVSRSTVDLRRAQLSTDTLQTAIHFLSHPTEVIALLERPSPIGSSGLLCSVIYWCARWLHLPLEPPAATTGDHDALGVHRTHCDLDTTTAMANAPSANTLGVYFYGHAERTECVPTSLSVLDPQSSPCPTDRRRARTLFPRTSPHGGDGACRTAGTTTTTAKLDAVLRIRQRDVDGLYSAHPARALSDLHPS